MTSNKFFSTFSIVLSILFFSLSANAVNVDGGPRHIIHTYAEVKVVQESQETITVMVTNDSGEIMAETVTNDLQASISTENWEEGHYTVEVIDENNEVEAFCYMKS